jgi:23S rRNA (guanosine2251-2'-O)-methyltransferase
MANYIYGFHSLISFLNTNSKLVKHIYLEKNRQDKRLKELIALTPSNQSNISYITSDELFKLTKTQNHQGVAAEVSLPSQITLKELLVTLDEINNCQILILDGITDPQNFGAIIRTAECFGVKAIIIPKNNSANINNPTVFKASSGAVNYLPIITVNNLTQAIKTLKDHQFWVAGTSLGDNSQSLYEFKFTGKLVWVMGSEGHGISHLVAENCDYLVNIPIMGQTQSLNVSVATGIILAYYAKILKNPN